MIGLKRLRQSKYFQYKWRAARERFGRVNPTAVFVVGNQKSGTSAIAGLLALYGGLSATIDIIPEIKRQLIPEVAAGNRPFEAVVRSYRHSLSRELVKHPNFVLVMDQLLDYFPKGRFVFVVRDPRDNIRSILDRLDLPGDLLELPSTAIDRLPEAWRRIIGVTDGTPGTYIEKLASRWNSAVDAYGGSRHRFVMVRYEDFLQDKVGEITRLARVLGIQERSAITTVVDRQFQPKGLHRGVAPSAFFGPANLEAIRRVCAARAAILGYEL